MNTWSKWCTKVKASFLIKTSSMIAWILCSTSHTPIWHELGEWTDTPSSPQQTSRHIHRQEALERRGVHSAVVLPTGSPSSPLATSETLPRQRLHMQIMTRCGAHSDTTHTTPVTQQDCKTCSYQKLVICPESFYRISFAVSLFPYSDIFSAVPEKFKKSALFQFSENHVLSDLLLVSQVKCFQSAPTWASPVNELDHDVLLLR